MKELEKILKLGSDYKIDKQVEKNENKKTIKVIYVSCKKKNDKCPECGKYTSGIHDKLKPIELKYLKIVEYDVKVIITKRRFICHKCNKKFTDNVDINENNYSISNKLKQKILKNLLNYNLSLKYIAKINNVSEDTVRDILKKAMSNYPEHLRLLPKVISLDEFKADTNNGKYAFVINDPIHKKILDILSNRKKEDLIQYFTYIENRSSVEFVISDMYEPYLLVTQIMFPKAKYVVDQFHYIRYIMEALDNIRIRLQKKYESNSKKYQMLKNKYIILRKYSNDIKWFTYTKRYKNGHTIENWLEYIVNSFIDKRYSNGYT